MKSIVDIKKEEEEINNRELKIKERAERIKLEIKKRTIALFEASKGERGYKLGDILKKLGTDESQNGILGPSIEWRANLLALSYVLEELTNEHKIEPDPSNTASDYRLRLEPIYCPLAQTANNPTNESPSFFWSLIMAIAILAILFFVFK